MISTLMPIISIIQVFDDDTSTDIDQFSDERSKPEKALDLDKWVALQILKWPLGYTLTVTISTLILKRQIM